ncbi:MAG: rod shape-determining protein MreD [Cyanobacteria bacterium P01_A01_bin.40]
MPSQSQRTFDILKILNIIVITASVMICSLLMLVNIPGMELLETNPNWLLIWLVAWSIKRPIWQSAIAGLIIGWIYDGIIASSPSHVLSLVLTSILTSSLQKQKYIGEDFISIALIVFFMSIFAETIFTWQYATNYFLDIPQVFSKYQQIVMISAIITSLWSPAFYYPFNLWHQRLRLWQKKAK